MEASIEGYYHLALEACTQASHLENEGRPTEALTEYRRSIALLETMRQLFHDTLQNTGGKCTLEVDDVEGVCKLRIARLEGELPTLGLPVHSPSRSRESSDSLN